MRSYTVCALLVLTLAFPARGSQPWDSDRTGSVYLGGRLGVSFPVGALADANYDLIASSWRKEGISVTGEFGYFITNSTIGGLEIAYTNFRPRDLAAFHGKDDSRVRIRRFGLFVMYNLVGEGRYRPFMKLGLGLFEASRISMPQYGTDPVEYRDYSLGAKPVYSVGFGLHTELTHRMSLQMTVEAVSLNSFSAAWESAGKTIGPLHKNMLYFPVYLGLLYHLGSD